MKNYLWNPFINIAGVKALIIGLAFILVTSIIGYTNNTYFPDLVSIKTGAHLGLQICIVFNMINWIISSLIFYLLSLILSSTRIRLIDFVGTFALARTPFVIGSFLGFFNVMNRFADFLMAKYSGGEADQLSAFDFTLVVVIMVMLLLILVWYCVLMFNALKVSSNLKGTKLIISYLTGIIISWLLSLFANYKLLQLFV